MVILFPGQCDKVNSRHTRLVKVVAAPPEGWKTSLTFPPKKVKHLIHQFFTKSPVQHSLPSLPHKKSPFEALGFRGFVLFFGSFFWSHSPFLSNLALLTQRPGCVLRSLPPLSPSACIHGGRGPEWQVVRG